MIDAQVDVEGVYIDDEQLARIRSLTNEVVILPLRRTEDGIGVYSRSSLFLVKELRAEGLDAAYLDPPESRSFEVLESAVTADLISMAIGCGSGLVTNTVWAGVQQFFARRRANRAAGGHVELTIVDVSEANGGQISVRGSRDDVLAVVERLGLDGRVTSTSADEHPDREAETQDDRGQNDV